MRLILIIYTCLVGYYVSAQHKNDTYSLKDKNYLRAAIIKNFYVLNGNTDSTAENAAIIQFKLKNGIIDTFYIWATKSNEAITKFIKPFLGTKIDKHDNVTFIIIPFIIHDASIDNGNNVIKDNKDFVWNFGSIYNKFPKNMAITKTVFININYPLKQ